MLLAMTGIKPDSPLSFVRESRDLDSLKKEGIVWRAQHQRRVDY